MNCCGKMCCSASRFSRNLSHISMTGKTAIVTGSNTGIGYETALDFARRDCKVILACRNMEKAEDAKRRIVEEIDCKDQNVRVMQLDLSSFTSVRQFAAKFQATETRLDVLVNNAACPFRFTMKYLVDLDKSFTAGVMMCPQSDTEDGLETHLQVNHLSHFLLTNLLLDMLKRSSTSRIVVISSILHEGGSIHWSDVNLRKCYSQSRAYYQSKLMNVLFVKHLATLLEGTKVSVFCVHPGLVKTEIVRHILSPSGNTYWNWKVRFSYLPGVEKLVWKSAADGAKTQVFCAIAPSIEHTTGGYYSECRLQRPSKAGRSAKDAKRLWELSLELTAELETKLDTD